MAAPATITPRNGQAPALAPKRDFLVQLDAARDGIASILPDPAKVDRVIRLVRPAWQTDGNIQECSPASILSAAMKACELGLDPCGARGHCYLIPYKKQCTLQVSYKGMLELAFRSGAFVAIEARTIHEGDHYRLAYNPEPIFEHVPKGATDGLSLTHAYAYGRLKTGGLVIEVLTRGQIEDVRRTAQSDKVWGPFYCEQAKKTAIKKLLKRQPSSVELAEAIDHDNREYDLRPRVALGVGATASARLGNRLAGPALSAPEDEPQDTPHTPENASQAVSDHDDESWDNEPGSNG